MPEKRPQRQNGGRTGGQRPWSLWAEGDLCGYCCGDTRVWCPDCGGFAGCSTCKRTYKVPCPQCSGGTREKFRP